MTLHAYTYMSYINNLLRMLRMKNVIVVSKIIFALPLETRYYASLVKKAAHFQHTIGTPMSLRSLSPICLNAAISTCNQVNSMKD
jgi:hypothetical protein